MKLYTSGMDKQTLRLASSYLVVMTLVSIIFSIVFYITSSNALHFTTFQHQAPSVMHSSDSPMIQLPTLPSTSQILQSQTALIKRRLAIQLISLNTSVLIAGGVISYYLARRTLRPIQQAMYMQQEFFSNASHELKTPLSALHLRGEVTLRNPSLTLAEAKKAISSNIEQAVKLEHLSSGLMQLAKTNYISNNLQHISLLSTVIGAIEQMKEMAAAKSIHISTDIPDITLYSDEQLLTQVLVIVLDNAIKYSLPNKSVYINAHRDKKIVVLSVHDEGPGISETDLPHIFERFYQGDQSRKREGFGLGLSIADAITHQLHGRISASSSSGGTTITIFIPVAKN